MKLIELNVCNFRSLKKVTILFRELTVLIGENDAGKSSVLDIMEMFLGSRRPDDRDFFYREFDSKTKEEEEAEFIEAIAVFEINDQDTEAKQFALVTSSDASTLNILKVRKLWNKNTVEVFYRGMQIKDSRLAQDFTKMKKPELESLIIELDGNIPSELKTNDDKIKWLQSKAEETERVEDWIPVSPKWGNFLPRFDRYRAIDYSNPASIVMKTLRQVFEQTIFEEVKKKDENGQDMKDENGQDIVERRIDQLKEDAENKIKEKVKELIDFVKRYAPRIQEISFEPSIDFSGGLKSGEFQVSDGRGLHYLSNVGDGTKRRIFMSILDWDREISLEQTPQGGNLPPIIRGYDEPDTNLHYEAQRLMYQAIADISESPNSHIQSILCTHSLTMIDRAPANSINLLSIKEDCTEVSCLKTDGDIDVENFLTYLAQQLGITNSILFYERCFILVEGPTEVNALPILYKKLYQRTMIEDGIRIINIEGNGSVESLLKIFCKNRQDLTIVFIDNDTQDSGARLTKDKLEKIGFSEEFFNKKLIFVGNKEFEDIFSDSLIASCLQKSYPKPHGQGNWASEDITNCRGSQNKKFSKALLDMVKSQFNHSYTIPKPEFAVKLAELCDNNDIPKDVIKLFKLAREIAGYNDPI